MKLPDEIPETQREFIAASAAAEASSGQRKPELPAESLAAEVEAILASAAFVAFSKTNRHKVRRESDAIRASYGDALGAGLREHHIGADLAKLPARQANARLRTSRLICKSTKARGTVRIDLSTSLRKAPVGTAGYGPWPAAEIEAFRTRWPVGTVQRACFELVFWTGSRTIDAVQLGRQHLSRDGLLVFRQSKTGCWAHVPWTLTLPSYATCGRPSATRSIQHWPASRAA